MAAYLVGTQTVQCQADNSKAMPVFFTNSQGLFQKYLYCRKQLLQTSRQKTSYLGLELNRGLYLITRRERKATICAETKFHK